MSAAQALINDDKIDNGVSYARRRYCFLEVV